MMLSNSLEALGFGFLTVAAYKLGGQIAALITLGLILLFVGFVLDGVKVQIPVSWWKSKEPEKKGLRLVDEPLTNREMDLLEQVPQE